MAPCEEHGAMTGTLQTLLTNQAVMQKDVEYLRRDTETILARFGSHVMEAEKPGGRHERMNNAENDIKAMKTQRTQDMIVQRWFMIGSGVIGGLMGAGAPEALTRIVRVFGLL
jgi:hypothetical protein